MATVFGKEYHAAWRAAHKQSVAAAQARYRAAHAQALRDKARPRTALRRVEKPEAVRAAIRAWQVQHPHSIRQYATARLRKVVEKVYRSVVFTRDQGICGECGIAVDPQNWHLDHVVPLSKGGEHSYANTQVTHPVCNLRKGTRHAS